MRLLAGLTLMVAVAILGQHAAAQAASSAPPGMTMQKMPTAGACQYTGSHTATIELTVGTTGQPRDEAIAVSSGDTCLDGQALRTVASYRFNPAIKNGQRVETRIRIQVNYKR